MNRVSMSTYFWALCARDGSVAIDELGRSYVFSSRAHARNNLGKAISQFGENLRVEKVEIF